MLTRRSYAHPSLTAPLCRRLAYDDFIAVAEDLIRRQVTSPARLGIRGGSNGGLLMGNMMVSE
jgi:prolyl oligopeptidase PreP (S9A serine peptidase family)